MYRAVSGIVQSTGRLVTYTCYVEVKAKSVPYSYLDDKVLIVTYQSCLRTMYFQCNPYRPPVVTNLDFPVPVSSMKNQTSTSGLLYFFFGIFSFYCCLPSGKNTKYTIHFTVELGMVAFYLLQNSQFDFHVKSESV